MEEKKQAQELRRQQDALYDQQRIHFKNLEDQARDQYTANQRAMTKAALSTNTQTYDSKRDREAHEKRNEQCQDQQELAWTNSTYLAKTGNLQAGLTQKSFGC